MATTEAPVPTSPRHLVATFLACLGLLGAAPLLAQHTATSVIDLKAAAAQLIADYGKAVATPTRESIASFYAPSGTIVRTIDGRMQRITRAGLDTIYRTRWQAPAFFAFDSFSYDSIAPGLVLASGRFRWQRQGSPDTIPYIYAALLEATDGALAIRFEHETLLPKRP